MEKLLCPNGSDEFPRGYGLELPASAIASSKALIDLQRRSPLLILTHAGQNDLRRLHLTLNTNESFTGSLPMHVDIAEGLNDSESLSTFNEPYKWRKEIVALTNVGVTASIRGWTIFSPVSVASRILCETLETYVPTDGEAWSISKRVASRGGDFPLSSLMAMRDLFVLTDYCDQGIPLRERQSRELQSFLDSMYENLTKAKGAVAVRWDEEKAEKGPIIAIYQSGWSMNRENTVELVHGRWSKASERTNVLLGFFPPLIASGSSL